MVFSNMLALTAAIVAVPVLTGLGKMQTPVAAQLPGDCVLQHVEYLDPATGETKLTEWQTYDCGAGLGVIAESAHG